MSIFKLYQHAEAKKINPFKSQDEFDLSKHCVKGKKILKGNWLKVKDVYKYIMLSCIEGLIDLGEDLVCPIQYKEVEKKYSDFKEANIPTTPKESDMLEAAFAGLKLIKLHEDLDTKEKVTAIDFDEFKTLLGLFEKQFQPVFQITILDMLFQKFSVRGCLAIRKFLIIFMSKIYSNAKRERSGIDPKLQLNQNFTVEDELILLDLTINNCKMELMRAILFNSTRIFHYNETLESVELFSEKAGLLSNLINDFDDDFKKTPLVCKDYEEAETFSKTMSKICSDGLVAYRKNPDLMKKIHKHTNALQNHEEMKVFVSGFVYSQTGKFILTMNRRVKFLKKAIGYFETLVLNGPVHSHAAGFLDECYNLMWNSLKKAYDENKTPDNLEKLREAAKNRLEKGEFYSALVRKGIVSKENFSDHLFDMMYCSFVVFQDKKKTSRYAKECAQHMLENPESSKRFAKNLGFNLYDYYHVGNPLKELSSELKLSMLTIRFR